MYIVHVSYNVYDISICHYALNDQNIKSLSKMYNYNEKMLRIS